MDYMKIWQAVERPPAEALRTIKGGRLNGKTDISPQWRMKIMTEVFGPCGMGWKYTIDKLWTEPGSENQIMAFALVSVYYKQDSEWSGPVPGIGGSMMIAAEKGGLHSSDEAYKMAVTDALSVAFKAVGVAAAIYSGLWDGAKYTDLPDPSITAEQAADLSAMMDEVKADRKKFLHFFSIASIDDLPSKKHRQAVAMLEAKRSAK
jgi:hypothetical protein